MSKADEVTRMESSVVVPIQEWCALCGNVPPHDAKCDIAHWQQRHQVQWDRAESAESALAAKDARLAATIPLMQQVMQSHADKDSYSYNECETEINRCEWCVQAQRIIDAALKGVKK